MPIPVACPSCGAKLTAPDAAAGKRVKCRGCQGVLVVPVPEPEPDLVIDDDEPAPTPPPAKRPAVVVEDDDDEEEEEEEEEEERPRKKKRKGKRKAKKPATNPMLFVGLGVGAVALLAVGFGVWHFAIREPRSAKTTDPATTAAVDKAAGWRIIDKPEFSIKLPPENATAENTQTVPGAGTRTTVYTWAFGNDRAFIATFGVMTAEAAASYAADPQAWLDAFTREVTGRFGGAKTTTAPATVAGQKGVEITLEIADRGKTIVTVQRYVVLKGKLFGVSTVGVDAATRQTFFDSLVAK